MNTATVDLKKIKIALTIELMNLQKRSNILCAVRDLMLQFKEVGKFLDLSVVERSRLDNLHIKRAYAIRFEQCQLNLELISNSKTKKHTINTFDLS